MFGFASKSKEELLKEQVKKWQTDLKAQTREIEHQIRSVKREEDKAVREAKVYAKKPGAEPAVLKSMARNVVAARRTVARLSVSKAHLDSVGRTLTTQAGESARARRHQRARARLPAARRPILRRAHPSPTPRAPLPQPSSRSAPWWARRTT